MSNEGKIDKRVVAIRAEIELCKKVETKFSREGDTDRGVAYIRALEEATRNVQLTLEQYEEIAAEARKNHEKRMARRGRKNGGSK